MQLSIFVRLYGTYVQRRENGPFFARPFFSGKWQQNWAWFILKSHYNLGEEDHYIPSVVPAYEYATVQWKFDQMKLVGKSVREILSCRCTFLQISLCCECFELLWMLGNVLNVVKYCECCKMSGNCDKNVAKCCGWCKILRTLQKVANVAKSCECCEMLRIL